MQGKMLFLMFQQNSMLYPSREFWKSGLDKAHSIIAKLTNARNLLLKNNEQQVDKPEMTEEQILKDARTWVDMYY